MEILPMAPSQYPYDDPTYTGQAPNMFLTSVGRQRGQHQQQQLFGQTSGASIGHEQGAVLPQPDNFGSGMSTSDLSNISWDGFSAADWEEHARLLGQRAGGQPGHNPPQSNMRFTSTPAATEFSPHDQALLASADSMPSSSAMEFSLSTSVSPGPEMLQDAFASPLTPASYGSEIQSLQNQHHLGQSRHRHMRSTPSPSQSTEMSELLRRKSAPAPSRNTASGSSNKVTKSPKPASSQAPANSRSAHSAIERKYRENINSKIMELHKVLCSAMPPIFPDQEAETGGYPYARAQRAEEDDENAESNLTPGQTTLPAKKADVLAGAVSYVKRSEREKQVLLEREAAIVETLNATRARLQQFEHAMAQARARAMGSHQG